MSLGGANTITALGSFAAADGAFALADTRALSVAGPLSAASVLLSAPTITEPGTIVTDTLSANGQSLGFTGSNTIGAVGSLTGTSSVALADTTGLAVDGPLAGAVVNLTLGGTLSEGPSGSVAASLLEGSATTIALTGTGNTVATLGRLTTAGGLSLLSQGGLVVAGPVSDQTSITLATTGLLALASNVSAPSITLGAGGSILQTTGTLTATTLGGSAGATVSLTDVNAVGTLGGFASRGGFLLGDGSALLVAGSLTDSASIGLNVGGNLTLAGRG